MRRLFLPQALVLLFISVGCARSRVEYQEIFIDDRIHIQLAETLEKNGQAVQKGFEHPWDVDVKVLDAMLASVLYKKGKVMIGGAKTHEGFPAFTRRRLLTPLREAFAKAGPNQTVDFLFVEARSTLKLFRRMYLTDGIMFRKGGKLNIAFRNIAHEEMGGEEEAEPNREDPTASPVRTSWTLVAGDGQALATGGRTGLLGSNTYTNWIRLDLAWPWGVSDAEIIEQAMPGTVDALESALPDEFALPNTEAPGGAEVQERLRFLEELRREGKISEDAYREKKRELELLDESPPEPGNP